MPRTARQRRCSARGCRAMDGPAKITGKAVLCGRASPGKPGPCRDRAEHDRGGRVRAIDTAAAKAAPGVLLVLTPDNVLPLNSASDLAGHAGARRSLSSAGAGRHLQRPARRGRRRRDFRAGDRGGGTGQGQLRRDAGDRRSRRSEAGEGIADRRDDQGMGRRRGALAAAPVRIEHEYRTPREYQCADRAARR